MRVLFTESARNSLRGIREYVERESSSKDVARGVINRIRQRCRVYAQYPQIGRVSESYGENVRRFPVGNYVVFYVPDDIGIVVLHVWHGARNLPDLIRAVAGE